MADNKLRELHDGQIGEPGPREAAATSPGGRPSPDCVASETAGGAAEGRGAPDEAHGGDGRGIEALIASAYDEMGPAPEQESRMLAALLAAQGDARGEDAREGGAAGGGRVAGKDEGAPAGAIASPGAKRSRGAAAWKLALPLAACLIAGAVAVGIGSLGPSGSPKLESLPAESAPAAATASANGADGPVAETLDESAGGATAAGQAMVLGEGLAEDEPQGLHALQSAEEASAVDDSAVVVPDADFNTEEYHAVEERGFVSTKTSPLSTVSADVDTASYCNLRRMLREGTALADVPTGAVRIEEMLNYFAYDYPAPTGDDKFSMSAQVSACPWNADTQLMVMGFASAPESKAASAGSNLVFLVDVSGSMSSPDKLDLLQDSFATLLEGLDGKDRVSIVTYANGEDIVLEGASGDDDKEILRAIYKLHASGSTNGEAGLKQAYEVARRNYREGGVNRIIMASDGDLNVGMSSESELHDYVDKQRQSGIYLSVLGFGSGNYKDNKMETLADHGNGSYHYIDCIDEAKRVFAENLTANLVPFADDVKVQVEFNPAQVKGYRLIGYDNRVLADEDFRDDAVDAGDVGQGAQFTVAYEIVPANSSFPVEETELKYGGSSGGFDGASDDWLTCTMRYHVFDADEMREQQLVVDASSVTASPSGDWSFAAAVIEFGMIARDSSYAGTSSVDSVVGLLDGFELTEERAAFRDLVRSSR